MNLVKSGLKQWNSGGKTLLVGAVCGVLILGASLSLPANKPFGKNDRDDNANQGPQLVKVAQGVRP